MPIRPRNPNAQSVHFVPNSRPAGLRLSGTAAFYHHSEIHATDIPQVTEDFRAVWLREHGSGNMPCKIIRSCRFCLSRFERPFLCGGRLGQRSERCRRSRPRPNGARSRRKSDRPHPRHFACGARPKSRTWRSRRLPPSRRSRGTLFLRLVRTSTRPPWYRRQGAGGRSHGRPAAPGVIITVGAAARRRVNAQHLVAYVQTYVTRKSHYESKH